jgi:hypothetical protein
MYLHNFGESHIERRKFQVQESVAEITLTWIIRQEFYRFFIICVTKLHHFVASFPNKETGLEMDSSYTIKYDMIA